ncbi:MAG: WD40/YVTN/BNR-like repeat-containing protein [Acidobacteriota bacterium]
MKKITFLLFLTLTLGFLFFVHYSSASYGPHFFKDLKYRCVGPSRGGRVTAVTGVASKPSTFYMGSTGGGVWKTTDYGQSWTNITDGYLETGSIGAIRAAPSDPKIIYVGTGSDGIRSNVITGRGVYKSTDEGKTWEFMGLREAGQIGAVEIHPQDPDIVFAGALGHAFGPNPVRGVFRSKDGGESWEKVLFVSEKTGAIDLELAPDNPNEIYACLWRGERKPWTIISGGKEGGIYKSSDGGDSWTKLTNGLPQELVGKSDLAVSPADPDWVYVLIEAPPGEGGVYLSEDRGETFQLVSTKKELLDRPFYYTNIDADPSDADIVYVNSTGFYKSIDRGKIWTRHSTPHGDNHDMWINPHNPDLFIQSNDGGANITQDGGKTWSTQNNQPTAELYQVNVDDQFPYWLYAGQQDNSTIAVPSLPPYTSPTGASGFWLSVGGCETGPVVPKPGNSDIVYANCKGRFGRYNKKTGQEKQYYVGAQYIYGHNPKDLKYRFQRVTPIHVSPHDPDVVYFASQFLHRSTDEGVTWKTISPDLTAFEPSKQVISGTPITRDITGEEFYSTIYAVQESPVKKGVIWVGANDGPVHISRDNGNTWNEVTPPSLPPGGRVQTLEPSPHRPGKAYVAVYRYLLDDWKPYVYKTEDYGQSWARLTTGENGIPKDYPTRVVREDPNREGLLYAGTEFGLFISFDDGKNWQSFQLNLPATPVTDIKIHHKDLVLSTMGRSFWILDDLTPLYQWDEQTSQAPYVLFKPQDSYRLHYRFWRRSPADPEYRPVGAFIHYYLAKEVSQDIKLEILDGQGNVVRTFIGQKNDPAQKTMDSESWDISRLHLEQKGEPQLSQARGMHRFLWDLRHLGAWQPSDQERGRRGFGGGPMVAPRTYQVKLSIGEWSPTREFEVKLDPRVVKDGVTPDAIREQEKLSLQIRDTLSLARLAAFRVEKALQNLTNKIQEADSQKEQAQELKEKLLEIKKKLVTRDDIRYPQPRLIDQIEYLYSMLNRADQKPGKDAYERHEELQSMLDPYLSEIKTVLIEVKKLNQ